MNEEREQELSRVIVEYDRRDSDPSYSDRWSELHAHIHMIVESRERAVLAALSAASLSMSSTRFLDVGCGKGHQLNKLLSYGAAPSNVAGTDLSTGRIDVARMSLPASVRLHAGSADQLPFEDGSFDVVLQYTLMSSVLSSELRAAISVEMLRVLRPGGLVIWYDMQRDSLVARRQWSKVDKSLIHWFSASEIDELFGGCSLSVKGLTLAPWIGDRVLRRSEMAYHLLERSSALQSHHLAVVTKR